MNTHVYIATSLDGFIARTNGDLDWLFAAADPASTDDHGYAAFMSTIDTLIMGRATFDFVAALDTWPYDGKRVFVCSSTKTLDDYPARLRGLVTIVRGTPDDAWRLAVREGARGIYADGGQVIQALLRSGRIDTLTITRIPVILGSGIPLFGPVDADIHCRHVSTTAFPSGFVQSTYNVLNADQSAK